MWSWLFGSEKGKWDSSPSSRQLRQVIGRRPKESRPYWEWQGWRNRAGTYVGYYRTPEGKWAGRVERTSSGLAFLIADPPDFLRQHRKWPCFTQVEKRTFRVHFYESPDLDAGILAIEQILHEACPRKGRKAVTPVSHSVEPSLPPTPSIIRNPRNTRQRPADANPLDYRSAWTWRSHEVNRRKDPLGVPTLIPLSDYSDYSKTKETKAEPLFALNEQVQELLNKTRSPLKSFTSKSILGEKSDESHYHYDPLSTIRSVEEMLCALRPDRD